MSDGAADIHEASAHTEDTTVSVTVARARRAGTHNTRSHTLAHARTRVSAAPALPAPAVPAPPRHPSHPRML